MDIAKKNKQLNKATKNMGVCIAVISIMLSNYPMTSIIWVASQYYNNTMVLQCNHTLTIILQYQYYIYILWFSPI